MSSPSHILLGGNQFLRLATPLVFRDQPVLRFDVTALNALVVDMTVPSPPARYPLLIRANRAAVQSIPVQVDAAATSIQVRAGSSAILVAVLLPNHAVQVVLLDLRPLGLAVWTEGESLMLGGARVSGNTLGGSIRFT